MTLAGFRRALLRWCAAQGRANLPWRHGITPYRVWVAEIMLQQTRAATVVPYYERFLGAFPTLEALAAAPLDAVLHLWSGLGYYARARNLHQAARLVLERHGGCLPQRVEELMALPGIGRSTAGAIAAIAFRQAAPILDANARRVLSRYHGVDRTAPGSEALLWEHARRHTSPRQPMEYTQAIMDLGALLCTAARPRCEECPLRPGCRAAAGNDPQRYSPRRRRGALPWRAAQLLLVEDGRGRLLLEKRPPAGIWGGLWSVPELGPREDAQAYCAVHLGAVAARRDWEEVRHSFSHYQLRIRPVHLRLAGKGEKRAGVMEADHRIWYKKGGAPLVGIAAPVQRLIKRWETGN